MRWMMVIVRGFQFLLDMRRVFSFRFREPEGNATWTKENTYGASFIDWSDYTDLEAVLNQLKVLRGDCNGDGKIEVVDALIILRYIAGIPQDDFNMEAANCDGDSNITVADALLVLKHVANILSLI